MDDAAQLMRLLGVLAIFGPFILSRIPIVRRHARTVGLIAAVVYILFGTGFVIWYTLIRA